MEFSERGPTPISLGRGHPGRAPWGEIAGRRFPHRRPKKKKLECPANGMASSVRSGMALRWSSCQFGFDTPTSLATNPVPPRTGGAAATIRRIIWPLDCRAIEHIYAPHPANPTAMATTQPA